MTPEKNYRKIAKEIPGKARQLFGLGFSQRQIAQRLKVSQYVVYLSKEGFYESNLSLKDFNSREIDRAKYFDETKHENWLI